MENGHESDTTGSKKVSLSEKDSKDLSRRLARIEGQVRGLAKMIEERRGCDEIVTQFQATLSALERVRFKMLASQIFECAQRQDATAEEDFKHLQALFLKLH